MALRAGDRVHQHTYGLGEIVEANQDRVTIAFDDGITRKFAAALVHLEPTAIPRPPKPQAAGRRRRKAAVSTPRRAASPKGAAS